MTAPLPIILQAAAAFFTALLLLRQVRRIPWRVLAAHPQTAHIFCAATLFLTLLAMMRTGTQPGLTLHLSGITAATLIMGRRLALVGGCLAHVLLCLLGREAWQNLGAGVLVHVVLPVYCSYAFCRLLQKTLPHNPFVFTLGAGFFGAVLALAAVMLAQSLVYRACGVYGWATLWDKYLKFLPVIIYPEGFLNGAVITAMTAFHARLISCFNPHSYFNPRKP